MIISCIEFGHWEYDGRKRPERSLLGKIENILLINVSEKKEGKICVELE